MRRYDKRKSGNVIIVENNDINKALNILRHKTAPLMKELKMKRFFETNTEKRRRKLKEAISREKTRQRKLEMYF